MATLREGIVAGAEIVGGVVRVNHLININGPVGHIRGITLRVSVDELADVIAALEDIQCNLLGATYFGA